MRIKITADSTCDLAARYIKDNHITLTPLLVEMNGKSYRDGLDIFPSDIFANVDAGGELCTTAAVNIAEYHQVFEKYAAEYEAVVHISLGSGFSSCCQNACLAAEDFTNVFVIDSKNLSTGQGYLVTEACIRSSQCNTLEDVAHMCEELRALTSRVETSFLLDRLDYMVKGGRCSSVVALGANLLKLKPCIEVIDGKMKVVKKYRGNFAKCLSDYVKERLDGRTDVVRDRMFITHTAMQQDALQAAKDAVSQYGKFNQVTETIAGCTISCHCGPNCLGVLFIRNQ